MRAVAKAARTNTPAVYRRFRTREDILLALVQFYQLEFLRTLEACDTLSEMTRCFLEYALSRPREYQLLMSGLLGRMTKSRPTLDFAVTRSSEWLGGAAGDHRGLVLLLGALAHGTAMLKITGVYSEGDFPLLQTAFSKAVDLLVANSVTFRS
jgi:AcrR family transcriptional regulator